MLFLLVVEALMAFMVGCADSVGEEERRTPVQRALRAVLWPVTMWVWFTRRSVPKLTRFGAIVWLFLTTGWLLALEYETFPRWAFLIAAEATVAFVVYCVDAMSADVHHSPVRRAARSLVWIKPVTDILRDRDSVKLIQASVTVWVLLTTGWLVALLFDRLAQPLGWL